MSRHAHSEDPLELADQHRFQGRYLLEGIGGQAAYAELVAALRSGNRLLGLGLPRAARLPIVAALREDLTWPILLVTDRADHALALHDELGFWTSSPRFLFAEPNPLFYEASAWGPTTRRQRVDVLTALGAWDSEGMDSGAPAPIILTSARSLMARTLPPQVFRESCRSIKAGDKAVLEGLVRQWMEVGYRRANTVLEAGQFSHRGGLLDVWPPHQPLPVRLDFFGDEIETIRQFDPSTQRTTAELGSLYTTPAREFISPASDNEAYTEWHIPILHPGAGSLLDHLPRQSLVLVDDLSTVEAMMNEVEEQAVDLRAESIRDGSLPADHPVPYLGWSELGDELHSRLALELGYSTSGIGGSAGDQRGLASLFGHDDRFAGRLKSFVEYMAALAEAGDQVHVVSRQAARLRELWLERPMARDLPEPQFVDASLTEGFVLRPPSGPPQHLITDSEIFGWERPQPRARPRQAAETPESVYADLSQGDYVVHIDHGIGHFAGLLQRDLDGNQREFLAVEYADGGSLYVPVHQADRLTRYLGPDGGVPTLDRLGGQGWSETKRRVTDAVQAIAEELVDLYARRHVVQGFAFKPDTAWQKELEVSFPYLETPDQSRALAEIKRDMERARPMDRLLCGDVGYGKTELALRAAFKAVMDGKQAAILVPTTVLAQQHYETFLQRLAAFPVKVEMLSRFRSPREQEQILSGLVAGEVDIVVGTHRLVSSDVVFKDLGLVIIDEEQRFGVVHKEHLKKLRTEVDVLTLTATPIPRTLYMALTGVRDISNLNTAPEERLSIVTHVGPYSTRLVRQAVLRELERGGQIFFVHNRVHTIDAVRSHLQQLVPEARIGVCHGQLDEHELARVMHSFTSGDIDLLLSTSIIESGLDIPNANTLVVDRADTFGLAQLYQLRGRVGRGAARAYAYFFRHHKQAPTQDGQQRLEVIAENTQLGAGYSIAMRDLEIRGAGELLGSRQHGHIAAVGFQLYTRLLADGVRRLRRAGSASPSTPAAPAELAMYSQPLSMPVNVDLPLPVGIPADYIADQDLRLRLYRRIADLRDEAEIEALGDEFRDRFGKPTEMVDNLFYQMRVKLRAEHAGLASVSWENGQILLRYPPAAEGRPSPALADLGPDVRRGRSAYWCSFAKRPDWRERLLSLLTELPRAEAGQEAGRPARTRIPDG